jgi:enoyl-[acyl-carrier protein] reductase I
MFSLSEKVGLVVGIADEQSVAWGCAKAFHGAGAEIAVTYLDDRAEPHVRAPAETLDAPTIVPLEATDAEQMDATFAAIDRKRGRLDFLLHGIAYRMMRRADVGAHAVFPAANGARNVTGGVHYVDGGYSITG